MGYNKRELSKIKMGEFTKPNPYKNDIITDPQGQWKFPGIPTRIPDNQITMEGVPYPVWAMPSTGEPTLMMPGQDYHFPDATYVDEVPTLKRGGLIKMPKKKNSKKFSRNLTATNKLFTESVLYRTGKGKVFDPNSKYYQEGGEFMELDLTPEEIEEYAKGGFIIEDISVPQLTKAQQGGAGKYKRTYDPLYDVKPQVAESTKPKNLPIVDKQVMPKAIAQKQAERKAVATAIKKSPLLTEKEKTEILMSPQKLDENVHLAYQAKPETLKASTPQSSISRAWDIVTNPFDAFEYSVRTGDVSNMPHNYNQMLIAGIDPSAGQGSNLVGNALNQSINLFDAGDKVVRNLGEGNYLTALGHASRFLPSARFRTGAGKKLPNSGQISNFLVKNNIINSDPDLVAAGFNPLKSMFNVDIKLKNIETTGLKKGLTPSEIAEQQMKEVGITSKQREAYTPLLSDLIYHSVNPVGTGWGIGGKLVNAPFNLAEALVTARKTAPGQKLGSRDDAWRMFLGKPQQANTFSLAKTSPTPGVYLDDQLNNLERFSINKLHEKPEGLLNDVLWNVTDRSGNVIPNKAKGFFEEGKSIYPQDNFGNVMGGYNLRRTAPNTLEYNDIWDLSVFGNNPIVNKFLGKKFLSTGQVSYNDLEQALLNSNLATGTSSVSTRLKEGLTKQFDRQIIDTPNALSSQTALPEEELFLNSIKDLNVDNLKKFISKETKLENNAGQFNLGVYDIPGHPNYLVKLENPASVAAVQGIPHYPTTDFVQMMQNIQSPNIAKVANQFSNDKGIRALVLEKMQGVPPNKLTPEDFLTMPDEAVVNFYNDLKELRNNNLGFDFVGQNYFWDPVTKRAKLFDVTPFAPGKSSDIFNDDPTHVFFQDEVFGGGNPYMYGREDAGKNLKKALEQRLHFDFVNSFGHDYDDNVELVNMFKDRLNTILKDLDYRKSGGVVIDDMSDDDIEYYKQQGYVIEEVD